MRYCEPQASLCRSRGIFSTNIHGIYDKAAIVTGDCGEEAIVAYYWVGTNSGDI